MNKLWHGYNTYNKDFHFILDLITPEIISIFRKGTKDVFLIITDLASLTH